MPERIQVGVLRRSFELDRAAVDAEGRTAELSFSSEEPYERFFGVEILDHDPDSVRLDRLRDGGPVLLNHNADKLVGAVSNVRIENGRGKATARFGRTAIANEALTNVADGILRGVSVGYRVHEMDLVKTEEGKPNTYRVVDWEPIEVSLTPIPADPTVGVGREADQEQPNWCEIHTRTLEEPNTMPKLEIDDRATPAEGPTPATPPPDTTTIRAEATEAERRRVREILAMGESIGLGRLAEEFVNAGQSADAFRAAALEKIAERNGPSVRAVPEAPKGEPVGLTRKQTRAFSLLRLVNAMANPTDRRAQEAAAFEFDACAAQAQKIGREPQGAFLPHEVVWGYGERVLNVTTEAADLITEEVVGSAFIDLLTNRMIMARYATMLTGLKNDVILPRLSTGVSATWVAESTGGDSTPAFDQVKLEPNTLIVSTDVTRKLLIQSSPAIENILRTDLTRAVALAIDLGAINGSGVNPNPLGILNVSGIGSETIGGTPTMDNFTSMWADVAAANADVGSLAWLCRPAVASKLMSTPRGDAGLMIVGEDRRLLGYPLEVSQQVPASTLIFGNFNDVLIAIWDSVDVLVDPYTVSNVANVRIRVVVEADTNVRHPGSFSAAVDITE